MTQGFSSFGGVTRKVGGVQPLLFSDAPGISEPGCASDVVTPSPREDVMTLSSLMDLVSQAIKNNFTNEIWVKGEIVESKRTPAGHYYLELVERGDDPSKPKAKVRANIWASNAARLAAKFKVATGSDLQSGISILIKVRVAISPTFGLALVVSDIDPTFTVGAMAAHIAQIKKRLHDEGVLQKNRRLLVPSDFFKIAVVAPESAAGLGDFKREADILHKYSVTEFEYFFAVFQGDKASGTISSAVFRAGQCGADAIVILRGGGGTADLQFLNDYEIANSICVAKIPVIVGIGHEKDKTLLDDVAAVSCGTPSKVIGYIASSLKSRRERGVSAMSDIRLTATALVSARRERSHRFMSVIQSGATVVTSKALARAGEILRNSGIYATRATSKKRTDAKLHMDNIVAGSQRLVDDRRKTSQMLFREISGQRPEKTLSRGFALSRDGNGKIITSAAVASEQTTMIVQYFDGSVNVELKK